MFRFEWFGNDTRAAARGKAPPPAEAVSGAPIFEVRDLRKDYETPAGPVRALGGASATIDRGITGIVGPNGGGKSTLLAILAGLMPPTSGGVFFRGQRLCYDDDRAVRQHRAYGVAVVFQELNLIGHLTARDNVALPLLYQGVGRREARTVAEENLSLVGLEELALRRPGELSRGQKQRVAVARAFSSQAQVVVADEPTGNLDPASTAAVMSAFHTLARARGRPVVLVTHDHPLADLHCDRILVCRTGKLAEVRADRLPALAATTGSGPGRLGVEEGSPARQESEDRS